MNRSHLVTPLHQSMKLPTGISVVLGNECLTIMHFQLLCDYAHRVLKMLKEAKSGSELNTSDSQAFC